MSIQLPSGLTISERAPLWPLTSWLVGGEAQFLAQPKNLLQLKEAVAWARVRQMDMTILGGGTNVLVSDQGVRGLTIGLGKMSGVELTEDHSCVPPRLHLACLSGTAKSELLKNFLKFRLEPALFLAGLPGDVGGGVVMNAGVGEMISPREFVEITDWVEVLRWPEARSNASVSDEALTSEMANFKIVRLSQSELAWSYRHCEGWQPGIVVRASLSWPIEPKEDILSRVKLANQVRLSKQPLDLPSCGSVFVNPPGHKSGQLIESSGLKGYSVGGAKVSEKHANFIVNFNKATALDIHRVIENVKSVVLNMHGVQLKTEVVYLGDW